MERKLTKEEVEAVTMDTYSKPIKKPIMSPPSVKKPYDRRFRLN